MSHIGNALMKKIGERERKMGLPAVVAPEPLTVVSINFKVPYTPISGNKFRHWSVRHRELKRWQQEFFAGISLQQRSILKGWCRDKAKVWMRVSVYHPRLFDQTNLETGLKPVEDALVTSGLLAGDSPAYLERVVTQHKHLGRGRRYTEFWIGREAANDRV